MAKQLVLLASVTAALGIAIAAGCSTPTLYVVDDDGGLFSSSSSGSSGHTSSSSSSSGSTSSSSSSSSGSTDGGIKKDSGVSPGFDSGTSSSGGGGTCPTTDPITSGDIDAQLQWKSPAAPVNVCSQGNIDALKNAFNNPPAGGLQYSDVKTALGATCSACVFSDLTNGLHWSVFPEDATGALNNQTGSCFAQVDSAVCGKARFQWEICLNAACADCATDTQFNTCVTAAQSGACSSLTTTYANTCPNEATDITKCGNVYQAIAVTCSGGPGNTINTNP